MKGGIDFIALLLGQVGGSGADLSAWRSGDHLVASGIDGKHPDFADGPDAGTGEDDWNDP
jgi:hypothetical protein